jgi:prepilin-type N-terminal cleavage/methylation domain-containing protein
LPEVEANGFTLIELLAALVVAATLITALLNAARVSQTRSENNRTAIAALQLAVAKMDEAERDQASWSRKQGNEGDLVWRRTTNRLQGLPNDNMALFSVRVLAGKKEQPRLIVLERRILVRAKQ